MNDRPFEMNHRHWAMPPWLALSLLLIFMIGCTTASGPSDFYQRNVNDFVREGDQFFKEGNYQRALSLYSSYIFTAAAQTEEFYQVRYRMGLCHFFLEEYGDAEVIMQEILQAKPDFTFADKAREIMNKSQEKLAQASQQREQEQKNYERDIAKLEALIEENPEEAGYHAQLGDLYWQTARYSEAVEQYEKAAQIDPRYLQTDRYRERVRIDQSGDYQVRNPLLRDQSQSDRVVIQNHNLQVFERENWLGTQEFVRITGEVINTGVRDVSNVQIEGTIFDFFERIQGTKVIDLGALPAGIRRPFSMTFTDYNPIGVDLQYDLRVYYQD